MRGTRAAGRAGAALAALLFGCALLLLRPQAALAQEDWSIEAFNVRINVQPDSRLSIRETIEVNFASPHHGIFRDIPVVYEWDQHNNRVYHLNITSVTDASGQAWNYQTSRVGADEEIKIGDANRTVSGRQTYAIAYTVEGALNGFEDHDELYWNVTGDQWAVPIKAADATVTVPGSGLLWIACFEGLRGSREACQNTSNPDQAQFSVTRSLTPTEQLTVVVGMRKGAAGNVAPILERKPRTFAEFFSFDPVPLGLGLLVLLGGAGWLARRVWLRGRDLEYGTAYYATKDPTEQVRPLFRPQAVVPEYTPPDNLRPAQLGLILDESADTKDVTATIVDLAVRGYLTIKDSGKHDWVLTKKKEGSEGLLPYEAQIFSGLFDSGKPDTRISKLKGTFSGTLQAAEKTLYNDSVRLKWFSTNPQNTRLIWIGLGILAILVGFGLAWLLGAVAGFGLVGVAVMLVGALTIIAAHWMPRRTGLGTNLFRKTLGFRLYMTKAEKDRQAFAEKAEIFTQYLPYAIVFGCVDRWAKAFEGIDTSKAVGTWYQGVGPFYPIAFASNLEGFSNTLSTAIAQTPGGSGGSGGGGGGFSGGGGGGGGGGAW